MNYYGLIQIMSSNRQNKRVKVSVQGFLENEWWKCSRSTEFSSIPCGSDTDCVFTNLIHDRSKDLIVKTSMQQSPRDISLTYAYTSICDFCCKRGKGLVRFSLRDGLEINANYYVCHCLLPSYQQW